MLGDPLKETRREGASSFATFHYEWEAHPPGSLPWEQVGTALRVYFLVAKKAAMESSPFQGGEQMEPTGNS